MGGRSRALRARAGAGAPPHAGRPHARGGAVPVRAAPGVQPHSHRAAGPDREARSAVPARHSAGDARMMKRGAIGAALCVAAGGAAQAPVVPPRPVLPPARPVAFPGVASLTLKNGLRVLVEENHAVPVVAIRVVLNDAPLDVSTDARLALDTALFREGTISRSAEQISDALIDLGQTALNPVRMTTTSAAFPQALELMADVFQHPIFPAAA